MNIVTYHIKDLNELADFFEKKAKLAEQRSKTAGPQIKARHAFEAAAYYDVVNVLRGTKLKETGK